MWEHLGKEDCWVYHEEENKLLDLTHIDTYYFPPSESRNKNFGIMLTVGASAIPMNVTAIDNDAWIGLYNEYTIAIPPEIVMGTQFGDSFIRICYNTLKYVARYANMYDDFVTYGHSIKMGTANNLFRVKDRERMQWATIIHPTMLPHSFWRCNWKGGVHVNFFSVYLSSEKEHSAMHPMYDDDEAFDRYFFEMGVAEMWQPHEENIRTFITERKWFETQQEEE